MPGGSKVMDTSIVTTLPLHTFGSTYTVRGIILNFIERVVYYDNQNSLQQGKMDNTSVKLPVENLLKVILHLRLDMSEYICHKLN